MKPVHFLGLGLLAGLTGLGSLLAVMSFRWQEAAYPEQAFTASAGAPPAGASAEVAAGKAGFQGKCASCHSIGDGRRAGPDLKGVTAQRPRDWLVEFIVAPDNVIASGDTTAAQLVQEYGMPMPNLGVSKTDAEQILAYIESQSGAAQP
jgi:Cytochrome c2